MAPRLDFSKILKEILGSNEVHFQPPSNVRMNYPAIVYHYRDAEVQHANNLPYHRERRYEVVLIARDPDNTIESKLAMLPKSSLARIYEADGLYHYAFDIYY